MREIDSKALGKIICDMRNKKNMSQQELSKEIFVSRTVISKWETGDNIPDLNQLLRLADYFGISFDSIMQRCAVDSYVNRNTKSKNGKKWVVGVVILLFVLTSVTSLILIKTKSDEKDIFYYENTLSSSGLNVNDALSINETSLYYNFTQGRIEKLEVEKTERTITECGNCLLRYVGTYVADFDKTADNTLGIDYRQIDYYKYEDDLHNYRAYYFHGTDVLCELYVSVSQNQGETEIVSEETAKENAIAFANKTLGESIVQQYTVNTESVPSFESSVERYVFCFTKKMFGYDTNDLFRIYVNADGSIKSYHGLLLGSSASVKDKKAIEEGFSKLNKKTEETGKANECDLILSGKRIMIGVDGKVYVFTELTDCFALKSKIQMGILIK